MPEYEALKSRFAGFDAQVLGVSVDNVPSNAAWANSLGGITFDLLSDFWPHGQVAARYGAFLADLGLASRTVVVVDKQGLVAYLAVHPLDTQPDTEALFAVLAQLPRLRRGERRVPQPPVPLPHARRGSRRT
jgi:alkyl hydroperoxide reductase subunit AhpC